MKMPNFILMPLLATVIFSCQAQSNQSASNSTAESSETTASEFKSGKNEVTFTSEGDEMRGNLYLPAYYQSGDQLPGLVVTGSWTTVKEQMPERYAKLLAERGYAALTFDFRGYGASGGEPRQYESPDMKIQDIRNAAAYLASVPVVKPESIGGMGVCASAGYMAYAVADDDRFKAFGAVVPWMHNAEIVKKLYGGESGVQWRTQAGEEARQQFEETGEVAYVPATSPTDTTAAMPGTFAYYQDPGRGAIPEWDNRFAVMSWPEWLGFDAIQPASQIDVPFVMVHSDSAATPDGARQFYEQVPGEKQEMWTDGTQLDFYDQQKQVTQSVDFVATQMDKYLKEAEEATTQN